MKIEHGVVRFHSGKFPTGEFRAVVFGEAENERETEVIPTIQWMAPGIVGEYCASCGPCVVFVSASQADEESAGEWAEGVAARIDQVVEMAIAEQGLLDDI